MTYIAKILHQSPWLINQSAIKDDVHLTRLHEFSLIYHDNKFLDFKFKDGVYIVTGPRQIGKSTHLKMFIQQQLTKENHQNFLYFNCDLLDKKSDIVDVVETYLNEFLSKQRRYLLLDEITSVKDSFLAIKFLVDSGRSKNLTYILTGSNTISIKKTGEYLPGRRGKGVDFNFSPLSFKDYIQLHYPNVDFNVNPDTPEKDFIALSKKIPLKKHLENYLMTGGFPRVINEYHQSEKIGDDIFNIYKSWITSEIAKSDKREYIAKSILERCLNSLSSDSSYNAFAQDTGIGSHNTVYDYIDFLSSAYIITQIYNYDPTQKKIHFRKNKKIYFNDPFIYAVLDGWLLGKPKQDFDYLKNPVKKSQLIENLVFLKLSITNSDVYFYKNNNEIDFVTNDYIAEVKYQNKIIPDDYKPLLKHDYKKILITKEYYKNENGVLIIPIEYFLLLNL